MELIDNSFLNNTCELNPTGYILSIKSQTHLFERNNKYDEENSFNLTLNSTSSLSKYVSGYPTTILIKKLYNQNASLLEQILSERNISEKGLTLSDIERKILENLENEVENEIKIKSGQPLTIIISLKDNFHRYFYNILSDVKISFKLTQENNNLFSIINAEVYSPIYKY